MIEKELLEKYGEYLDQLDIYETNTSLKLSMIKVKPEYRYQKSNYGNNLKIGTKVMTDLVKYADDNNKIVTLTPDNIDGVNVNTLIQFYKKFRFKMNTGYSKNYEYRDTMIRLPKREGMKENFKPMIKSLLREGLMTKDEDDVLNISDFVNFAKKLLSIDDDVKVELAFEKTPDLKTTAYYHNSDRRVKVYVKDRAKIDIMRSIAHELVHHKQNLDGRLTDTEKDGADGSPIENEANSLAGIIMRKWGRLHPEDYV
jgi:hypothetical protein